MKQEHLTFVHQVACRIVDESFEDTGTVVVRAATFFSDEARLLRGVSQLLAVANGKNGIHYGLIGSSGELVSHGVMLGGSDAVDTAVIGRHSHSDTRAVADGFALRHALLVRHRERAAELRVYDLGSAEGTRTMGGASLSGASVDLPCALRLGPCLLVVISGENAALGARGVVDLCQLSLVRANEATVTRPFIFSLDDFSAAVAIENTDAGQLGRLSFSSDGVRELTQSSLLPGFDRGSASGPTRQAIFRPNADALSRGMLLGRYERCAEPATMQWDDQMSRVHALLFSMGKAVYLADLGSTNGTRHERLGELRLKHVAAGDVFWLGNTRLSVEACL